MRKGIAMNLLIKGLFRTVEIVLSQNRLSHLNEQFVRARLRRGHHNRWLNVNLKSKKSKSKLGLEHCNPDNYTDTFHLMTFSI